MTQSTANMTAQQTEDYLKSIQPRPLPDSIPGATLELRRLQESLWLKIENGKAVWITLSSKGQVDYPLRDSSGRVLYDWPERLSKPFRKMVWARLNRP